MLFSCFIIVFWFFNGLFFCFYNEFFFLFCSRIKIIICLFLERIFSRNGVTRKWVPGRSPGTGVLFSHFNEIMKHRYGSGPGRIWTDGHLVMSQTLHQTKLQALRKLTVKISEEKHFPRNYEPWEVKGIMAPSHGLEPWTLWLTATRSTYWATTA